jgi:serine/threonine protein kinase
MSTNSDLATWGEPPATPAEEALGTLLDQVLTKIERGKSVKPEALRGDRPELWERGQGLVRTVGLLYECAASVWGNSRLEPGDEPVGPTRYSLLGASSPAPQRPGKKENKMPGTPVAKAASMPDPFPGEFLIRRLLGEGAFGKVWLADDVKLGRPVALKTLKLPATSTIGPQVLAALRKEAQHLAQLDHPNIVRVYSWREAGAEYYLVLQFVTGGSLADRLQAEKVLGWQDAARYVADVGEALVAAHKRGVIHRDIKPENILWEATRNEAILTDFGVSARLAEPGTVAGTPAYMAPEAFEGQVSPALDVYSLAATLYRLATGKLPFAKAVVPDLVRQKRQGLADPDPRCKAIPEALERIIRAGLAGKAGDRPGMADFVAMVRASLNQLLADALATPTAGAGSKAPVNLQLVVSRRVQGDTYEPVATTKPPSGGLSRDMKKVPLPPEQVRVRTGERVRIEVTVDKAGYVTVFNIGPTGNLNLLYPDDPATMTPPVDANRPLHVVDVTMTPPVGEERLFAVWSKEPLPLRPEQLRSIARPSERAGSRPYQATRDMQRVRASANQLGKVDWRAVVLELNHIDM